MTNDVVSFKGLTAEEIMQAIGQNVQTRQLPQLSINRQGDDDQGRQLPVGVYAIWSNEIRQNVYAKPVFFRPFLNLYQYRKYDPTSNSYVNKSILFRNWNEDIIDELGGIRCGKISGKAALGLSDAEKARNKQIQCVRYLYGTVSGPSSKSVDGTAAAIENLPCLWRTRGVAFQPIGEAIEGLTKQNKFMFNHVFKLTTKREQTGSNVYYSPVLELTDQVIDLSDEDALIMRQFQELVQAQNNEVYTKWQAATRKKLNDQEKTLVKTLTTPLDADFAEVAVDFDDDISDVGGTPMNSMMAG